MYKPLFNTVLVEIDDKQAKWGKGNDDSLGGEVFREGKLLDVGSFVPTGDYPASLQDLIVIREDTGAMIGKTVMWNEGHEAGTVFEDNGKKYALLYWWDIRGVKDEQ